MSVITVDENIARNFVVKKHSVLFYKKNLHLLRVNYSPITLLEIIRYWESLKFSDSKLKQILQRRLLMRSKLTILITQYFHGNGGNVVT